MKDTLPCTQNANWFCCWEFETSTVQPATVVGGLNTDQKSHHSDGADGNNTEECRWDVPKTWKSGDLPGGGGLFKCLNFLSIFGRSRHSYTLFQICSVGKKQGSRSSKSIMPSSWHHNKYIVRQAPLLNATIQSLRQNRHDRAQIPTNLHPCNSFNLHYILYLCGIY